MEWDLDTIGKIIAGGADIASRYNQFDTSRKARDAQSAAAQEAFNIAAQEDQADAAFQSAMAGYRARNQAAANSAAARTQANKLAAENKAFKGYEKNQKKLQKVYDPYVQMYSRLMPAMEQGYMSGLTNISDLLNSAKANKKNRATQITELNLGVPK